MDAVRRLFPNHIVSSYGDIPWPARSSDLTACEFFLWGYLKSMVFKTPPPQNIEELKEKFRDEVADIPEDTLGRVMGNIQPRLEEYMQRNGSHLRDHYKKTGGACRIEGYMYEFKMPGLIFLRLINERKSFHIASNMEAAGKFDDLVLRIDGIPTFVQLKHKLGAQNSAERRYNVHRIFAMKEHYSSYCDLKKEWEEKTDLQLWGPFSDVQFVVYTNAVVTVGEAIDADVQNVLMTGGKCFRFSENDFPKLKNEPDFNQFLHQFRFYTEQASQEELDSLIRTELRRALGTDSQFQTFLTNVENWMKDPLTYLTENVEFWKDMVKCSVSDLNREKVDQLAKFNLQFDETELILFRQKLPEGGGLLSVQNSNVLTCLKVHQSIDKKILVDAIVLEDRMSEVLALWGRWSGCDVLVIDGWVETIEKLVDSLGSRKILVVIHDSDKLWQLKPLSHKDEFHFRQLNEESKKHVLDCKIYFQGESMKLNILVDDATFDEVANAEIVTHLVSGISESIGDKLPQQNEHYIPRKFSNREHVSNTIFSDDRDCLVVSGVSLQTLRNIVQPEKEVELFDETKLSEICVCRCFVIGGQEDFEKAKNVFKRVHWLHKVETGFIWKECGSVSYIKSHLMDVTSIRGLQEVMLLSGKVNLLVAHPGMGKSTEVVNLAQEFKRCEPAYWVVTVVLNEHTDYLSNCGDSAVELLLQAGKFTSDFATSLFKHELHNGGNVVILIDGFDEISPDYAEKVVHMFRQLIIECKFKQIWITSRSLMKDMLEEKFSCLSFELQPFTEQDQRDFLANLWNDINVGPYNLDIFITNLLEVTGNSLNDKLGQFTEIPLQTFMLAEVFRSEASHFCQSNEMKFDSKLDLLELYNRFVTNLVQHRLLQLQKEEYEKDHMACAVHSLLKTEDFNKLHFSKDVMRRVEGFQDQFRNGYEKIGIVAQIVNSTAVFTHRTFLEFFAANWFTKYFKDEREFIEEILFREEFVIVREFFDRILAEGFELHTAILNEDKEYVLELLSSPECDVKEKDKGGRTPLHLGVISYTESHDFSPNKVMCEILELLLQNHCDCRAEEGVFHWRPLTLADKIQAWSAVDMLLGSRAESSDMIFTMELIKGEEGNEFLSRLLKIVALQGYMNIAKLMFKCGICVNHSFKTYVNHNGFGKYVIATMLHIASSAGQMKLVEFLLEAEETQGFIKKSTLAWALPQPHLETEETSTLTVKMRLETKDSDYKTPLSWAAYKGDLEMVSLLVEKGADVNVYDAWKLTPLYYAITGCHLNVVQFLIENGADVNACNNNGDSPITVAAEQGNVDVVKLLMDKGADVNACNNFGASVIFSAKRGVGESPIFAAAKAGNVDVVRFLMDKGADVNACNDFGQSLIFAAVKGGSVHIMRLLLDKGCDLKACNDIGESPIFAAAKRGNVDIVRLLMDKGADVNACNNSRESPIFAAARGGNVDIVRLIMDKGADVNACNNSRESPIFAAARGGNVDIVRLMMDKGADVKACNNIGESVIFVAAEGGNVDIVSLLMDNGADVNACNDFGESLIFSAVKGGTVDLVRLLMEKGAVVNAYNNIGERPIFAAARGGNVDIVRLLMDKGADVNGCNCFGESVLFAAAKLGSVDIVKLLIDKGADVNACNNIGERAIFAAVKEDSVKIRGNCDTLIDEGADVNASNKNGENLIFTAAKAGSVNIVRLLMHNGADVNASNIIGESVIFAAAKGGNVDIVRLLMDKGADVKACNSFGDSPIFVAVEGGNMDIVRLLLDNGADVNACNDIGESLIFAATEGGNVDIVRLLMDKGADINVCNNIGESLIFAAAAGGNVDIVRLLMDKGAVKACNDFGESLIFTAAKGGNVDIVRLLMEEDVDVNACNNFGGSPIFAAAEGGNVDIVRLLMDKGADVKACNSFGESPIFAAIIGSNVDIVRLLIDKGADVNACNNIGESLIFAAVKGGNVDIVRLLMDEGADVSACNNSRESPIFAAARGGNVDIVRLLMDKGADVQACNSFRESPIFAAVEGGNVDIVRLLMDKGADVQACNSFRESPIFAAAEGGNVDIVRLLMEKGADVQACNFFGQKGGNLDIVKLLIDKGADVNACNNIGDSLIFAAAKGGSVDIVRLLMDKGVDINTCDNHGQSLIVAAVEGGSVDIVRLLISKGADVNACDNHGESLIFAAAKQGSVDIVRLLMNKGVDINACDIHGESLIFAAAKRGSVDIVRLLMDKGVDINTCDNHGQSLIVAAVEGGSVDIVRLLISKGADVNACDNHGESLIFAAAKQGSVDIVWLLMNKGADVNACDIHGERPIFAAAKRRSWCIVRLLMHKGADVNACNNIGESLIFAAAKGGSVDIVTLLLDKDADVNACKNIGESLIFAAVTELMWILTKVYHGITNRNRSAFFKAVRPTGSGPFLSIMAPQGKARMSVQASTKNEKCCKTSSVPSSASNGGRKVNKRRTYSVVNLQNTVKMVLNDNWTIYKPAKECGVPWSTLKVHISRNVGDADVGEGGPFEVPKLRRPFMLPVPKLVELRLVKYIIEMQELGFGLNVTQIKRLGFELSKTTSKTSSFNEDREKMRTILVVVIQTKIWLIIESTRKVSTRPVLLLLDSHASHVGIGVVDLARENDIHLMTFPSHCSHILQPLDLSVYKSLKNAWANKLERYKHNNPVGAPTRFDFGKLFSVPYAIEFSAETIRDGFRKAGIYPMNRNAVQSEAIASSRLIARD
ncbi:hypothetical protein ANN_27460 [Periplaneta americana]|uniref:DDE-1 domain-containing protein n=1 Tax=Periplaneta americana TaxID=6978 RepID=A0ABQ8RVU1_PERAM|nr:hypothetical protein ANN_27460 [Periplaneta americana]